MNVALSRHVAALMQQEPLRALEFARRRELATAVDRVDDASELPEWMAQLIAEAEANAEEHDRILACTSHLPFLLSSALALATPPDVAPFIGPGFRSASRLAGTPGSMMLGVVLSNRENLLVALERLQDELALFTAAIAENDSEALKVSLNAAQTAYLKLNGAK